MSRVVAKFYVSSITLNSWNKDAVAIVMQPVTRGDENKGWAAATPTGKVEMVILNEKAATAFLLGGGVPDHLRARPASGRLTSDQSGGCG